MQPLFRLEATDAEDESWYYAASDHLTVLSQLCLCLSPILNSSSDENYLCQFLIEQVRVKRTVVIVVIATPVPHHPYACTHVSIKSKRMLSHTYAPTDKIFR
jgi:hypothetical protein